jgi:hypothetical protein
MALQFTTSYLEDTTSLFHHYKNLAERAMDQVASEQLFAVLDPEMNSIAIILKHLTGNMRSRWTGFPQADGEKPDRDRDSEFVNPPATREELMRAWEQAWSIVFAALGSLSDADLARETTIRGERHSILQAVTRQLTHYAYHCGQIVLLAKHFQGAQWKSLTVPRGQSAKFNQRVKAGEASQR